ncbi:MAG: M23 family metallopeptidase [Myxococcota bacterium]|jgi:septal ring factor EnvC (AmiA/AmiB activator)|nr:M23 family metallopeptidase [Myxococcota bacterium]
MRRSLLVATGVALLAVPLATQGQPDSEAFVASARVLELTAREQLLLDELEQIETRLLVLHTDLQALHIQERELESHLSDLDRELEQQEKELEQRQLAVRFRVRALYMSSERSFLQLLFSAQDLRDLLMGSRYLAYVLRLDDEALSALNLQVDATQSLRDEREAEWQTLRGRITTRQQMQEEQRGLRERRGDLLGRVRNERRSAAIAALAADRAEEAVAEVTRSGEPPASPPVDTAAAAVAAVDPPVRSVGFSIQQGRLLFPAVGDVAGGFGWHAVEGTSERAFRRGLDIDAPPGADVRAVFAAQVRRAEWIRGFGNVVILDHGESYFTVYAHLEEFSVEVGEMVSTGQIIGRVGETGSMRGPYLHFEIRHQGQPIDPLDWVQIPPGVSLP